jgi:MraZ protein
MFYGSYPATLDEKGRVHVPSVFAKDVGESETVMVADWGKCVAAFPPAAFEEMAKRFLELSKNKKHREKVHRIVSSFYESSIKNGTLLIPQKLRDDKKFGKKVAIVGMLNHMEIWDQRDWDEKDIGRKKTGIRGDLDALDIL